MAQQRIRKARQKARRRTEEELADEATPTESKAVTRARRVSANAKRFLERTDSE